VTLERSPIQWCVLEFDDGRGTRTADQRRLSSSFRLDRLSLYMSRPVLEWEFHPASLWAGFEMVRPQPPSAQHAPTLRQLVSQFENAVERCIGGAERVGVSLSGGLDSAAVLSHAARIAERNGFALTALITAMSDDAGRSNVPIAAALAARLAPQAEVRILDEDDLAEVKPPWDPIGPRLDAVARARAGTQIMARRLGIDVILTGVGADELMGASRYLLPALLRQPRSAIRYLRDLRGLTLPTAIGLETAAALSRLAPRRVSGRLYWSLNNPEVATADPSRALTPRYAAIAEAWTREWLAESLQTRILRDWSRLDAYDAVYPYDSLASAGVIPEISPYLEPAFFASAMAIPPRQKYSARYASPYHRRKCLVLSLLPDRIHDVLPRQKQLFSAGIARERARLAEELRKPWRCVELGVIDDRMELTARESAMVTAIEAWIRGAEAVGAVAS
jgi:asparagine synthetase B (glutamine-hydrolysing)